MALARLAKYRDKPPEESPPLLKRHYQADRTVRERRFDLGWAASISKDEWRLYKRAIKALRSAGVDFMLGGGFAQAAFTGRWRNTKDIDFYIHPRDRAAAVDALEQAEFEDYYSKLPYDRKWIHRNIQDEVIVDIIWAMANQRAQVDELWFSRSGLATLRDERLKVVPLEEFLWCKIYIVQRDRCDWVDIFNLLCFHASELDWTHLIQRLEDDLPLLQGLLTLYNWICPDQTSAIPAAVLKRLHIGPPLGNGKRTWRERIRLLDSRDWFAPLKAKGERLEI
jgi:hypothetical protein